MNFDIEALEAAVSDRTRLIFAVNLLGNPNDFGEIHKIAAARGITLIEDNCESLGAELNGRKTGTFGLMGSFSSFFSHHISTMEGGVVLTDDEDIYHILLSLRAHGWTRNLPKEHVLQEPRILTISLSLFDLFCLAITSGHWSFQGPSDVNRSRNWMR